MALWKPNPEDPVKRSEHVGRRLFEEPTLTGAQDQKPLGRLDFRHFEEKRDAQISVDRLGQTSVDKSVVRYLRPRAAVASGRFRPPRAFTGWAVITAGKLEKPPAPHRSHAVIPSPEVGDELNENVYHAHITTPPDLDAYSMALHLRELFVAYGSITRIEPEKAKGEALKMNLRQWFDLTFGPRANQEALEWAGQVFTFGEVDARSNRMARTLEARGLTKGDRLCVYLANSIEMIDLYLACVKLGVIFVPINILYRDREMSHILSDAEPKLLITEKEIPGLLAEASKQSGAKLPDSGLTGDDVAALVYTSGTTGVSKGAMLTHNNFAINAMNLIEAWRIVPQDRFLLAPPLFHVHALGNGLHCWLFSGCRMRLLERFDHHTAVEQFLDFKPSLFFGVPAMYVRLLETTAAQAREIGRRMRLFVCGSAPLPAQILEEFRALFGHTILERYGMTETIMNVSNPYDGERRPGSIGLPLPNVRIKIIKPDGAPAAAGETGELWLQGPNVFAGYWRRPEASEAAFVDGWFKTGDIGVRSADGYFTLSGRKSDLIISGGFNIYPREIEEFLMEQPEIAEAAVAGEADRVRGEIPVAYIVWREGATHDAVALEARCREKLASFKIPRRFEAIEKLPRNALGKVQKHLLCPAS